MKTFYFTYVSWEWAEYCDGFDKSPGMGVYECQAENVAVATALFKKHLESEEEYSSFYQVSETKPEFEYL